MGIFILHINNPSTQLLLVDLLFSGVSWYILFNCLLVIITLSHLGPAVDRGPEAQWIIIMLILGLRCVAVMLTNGGSEQSERTVEGQELLALNVVEI